MFTSDLVKSQTLWATIETMWILAPGYRTDVEGEDGPFVDIAAGLRMSDSASLELTAQYSEVATERLNTDGYTSVFLTLKRRF